MAGKSLEHMITGIANGERRAFHQLYDATSAKLYGVAIRILKRRELAEEVVHDTYLKIWHHASEFTTTRSGSPMTWMMSITRNRAIDVLRKRTEARLPEAPEHQDVPSGDPDPLALAVQSAELRALMACLSDVEPDHVKCLLMAYYQGFTHEEIAEELGVPVGTVKSRVRRTLAKVRDCLADDGT